ncbi:MAG: helix-turn-helix domain-containing protein [Candidatus Omnitrophota bacterium]|jgi:excisionase family DNA binding protein
MPEKLLTIKEVADYLKLPEEEVKRLVDIGEIPAYRIGGSFLRFRKEQLDVIRNEITEFETEEKDHGKVPVELPGKEGHPYTEMEREIRKKQPVVRQFDYTFAERIKDFFYFNDFYILSFLVIGVLLYVIFQKT